MDYQEAIENHIKECRHRIDIIRNHMNTNGDADKGVCNKNIEVLEISIHVMQGLQQYKQIGTLEEVREAVEKQKPKKPKYKHYEDIGKPPYIKIACPNGCRIQLHPVTDKHLAYEHDYCPKCGQKIDWSEEDEIN